MCYFRVRNCISKIKKKGGLQAERESMQTQRIVTLLRAVYECIRQLLIITCYHPSPRMILPVIIRIGPVCSDSNFSQLLPWSYRDVGLQI